MVDNQVILTKLEMLITMVGELKATLSDHHLRIATLELYRERVDGRLNMGNERMTQIEKDAATEANACKSRFEEVERRLEGYIEKKVVFAFLLGTGLVSGGIGALLVKLLSH